MTDRKILMRITIFDDADLTTKIETLSSHPQVPVTPRDLILGVVCAMEEFFKDAFETGAVKTLNDLN